MASRSSNDRERTRLQQKRNQLEKEIADLMAQVAALGSTLAASPHPPGPLTPDKPRHGRWTEVAGAVAVSTGVTVLGSKVLFSASQP